MTADPARDAMTAAEELHADDMMGPTPTGAHPAQKFYVPFEKCGAPKCVRLREAIRTLSSELAAARESLEAYRKHHEQHHEEGGFPQLPHKHTPYPVPNPMYVDWLARAEALSRKLAEAERLINQAWAAFPDTKEVERLLASFSSDLAGRGSGHTAYCLTHGSPCCCGSKRRGSAENQECGT